MIPTIGRLVHYTLSAQDAAVWNGPGPAHSGAPPVPGQSWFKLQNLGQNAADLWVYDEIGAWGVTAEGLVSELAALNVSDITLHLNSPGGDVFDGIAIMNALRDHPARVTVKVDALAASIASVIAQAGDEVIMGRNSTMMIHNASGFAMGEAKDMIKMGELLQQTTDNIASIYADRAGGTAADWLALMDEETWFTAAEAVKAGLADSVAPLPNEREAHQQAARFDLSVYNRAPTIVDVDPEIEPLPEPRVPAPAVTWNADAFRESVTAALPQPITWDPDVVRAAVALVVNDAPQAPTQTPETAPVVETGWNPDLFALAMREARR